MTQKIPGLLYGSIKKPNFSPIITLKNRAWFLPSVLEQILNPKTNNPKSTLYPSLPTSSTQCRQGLPFTYSSEQYPCFIWQKSHLPPSYVSITCQPEDTKICTLITEAHVQRREAGKGIWVVIDSSELFDSKVGTHHYTVHEYMRNKGLKCAGSCERGGQLLNLVTLHYMTSAREPTWFYKEHQHFSVTKTSFQKQPHP